MREITKVHLPSLGVILVGVYIAALGIKSFLASGQGLGFLPEIVFLAHLLFGGILVAIGAFGIWNDWIALPAATLVGAVVLLGTFVIDLYQVSDDTQFVVTLGVLVSLVPAVVTWIALHHVGQKRAENQSLT